MNKAEVYELLKSKGIEHEITEHEAVYNMEELDAVELPYPDADAKNLFVRDDKKINYYLITVKGDKRVDLKAFRKVHGFKEYRHPFTAERVARLRQFEPDQYGNIARFHAVHRL